MGLLRIAGTELLIQLENRDCVLQQALDDDEAE